MGLWGSDTVLLDWVPMHCAYRNDTRATRPPTPATPLIPQSPHLLKPSALEQAPLPPRLRIRRGMHDPTFSPRPAPPPKTPDSNAARRFGAPDPEVVLDGVLDPDGTAGGGAGVSAAVGAVEGAAGRAALGPHPTSNPAGVVRGVPATLASDPTGPALTCCPISSAASLHLAVVSSSRWLWVRPCAPSSLSP